MNYDGILYVPIKKAFISFIYNIMEINILLSIF